jgi:carbohydrate kinase (thermoresistant glucokinase family)
MAQPVTLRKLLPLQSAAERDVLEPPIVVIVMGVSGSGKSTLGHALAQRLGWAFCEGDALHPQRNVEKMRRGTALSDADRRPWLAAIRQWIDTRLQSGQSGVVSCSALKRRYRQLLGTRRSGVRLLFLHGSRRVIAERLRHRRRHFMPASLLDSQLATLQAPAASERAARVDIGYGLLTDKLATALRRLRLNPQPHS